MRMFWHPKTGEPVVVGDTEAPPANYLDHHPADEDTDKAAPEPSKKAPAGGKSPAPVKAPKAGDEPMSRDELAAALKAGHIAYNVDASAEELSLVLVDALHAYLATSNVPFTPEDGPRALLALAAK